MVAGALRSLYLPPFRVDLEVRAGVPVIVAGASLARVLRVALLAGGAPEPAAVGLVLADDTELARLNAAHLGHRGPTDVLSFPLLPPEAFPPHEGGHRRAAVQGRAARASRRDGPPDAGRAFLLPPGARLHVGDIVVSVERAIEQAEGGRGGQAGDLRWSPADELRLLVVHGALHLCGWDHAEPAERSAMRALEVSILDAPAR
ncbi:MAG TPA: rRNA maturation RNase YbeY [Patescibacteria group bacterium]|nr:rRNA maturation RNase YbeY [Patescibacteria group bacterium]